MKQYTLAIVADEWNGSGFDYEQLLLRSETNVSEWTREEFIDWINDGKDFEDLQEIVANRDKHDVKYTLTVYDDDDNITCSYVIWESSAAETALEE